MDFVVNTHTATIHTPRDEFSFDGTPREAPDCDLRTGPGEKITECGALSGVPGEHLAVLPEGRVRERESTTRCGRCFRGKGGY